MVYELLQFRVYLESLGCLGHLEPEGRRAQKASEVQKEIEERKECKERKALKGKVLLMLVFWLNWFNTFGNVIMLISNRVFLVFMVPMVHQDPRENK